jgi:hypothetical protein
MLSSVAWAATSRASPAAHRYLSRRARGVSRGSNIYSSCPSPPRPGDSLPRVIGSFTRICRPMGWPRSSMRCLGTNSAPIAGAATSERTTQRRIRTSNGMNGPTGNCRVPYARTGPHAGAQRDNRVIRRYGVPVRPARMVCHPRPCPNQRCVVGPQVFPVRVDTIPIRCPISILRYSSCSPGEGCKL